MVEDPGLDLEAEGVAVLREGVGLEKLAGERSLALKPPPEAVGVFLW